MWQKFRYDDVPVVATTSGKLKGYFWEGEYIFKGIPYAQAKRFQMPEDVTPWEGVKEVTSYGFVCPLLTPETPNGELMVPHRYWPSSEHCQNLNIWTRELSPEAKKPVIVWLHGGGPVRGDYYFGAPLDVGFRKHAYQIPLMIGTVFGEVSFNAPDFNKYELTDEEIRTILAKTYGNRTNEVIDAFATAYPGKNPTDVLSLDRFLRQPSKRIAQLHAEGKQAPTYMYNFTLEFPYHNGKTAWHCADLPFIFNNTDKVEVCNIPGVSDQLEKQIFGGLIAFAKTGCPGHEGLPEWPPVTPDTVPTMIYDQTCEVRYDYDEELHALLDDVLQPFNIIDLAFQDQKFQH